MNINRWFMFVNCHYLGMDNNCILWKYTLFQVLLHHMKIGFWTYVICLSCIISLTFEWLEVSVWLVQSSRRCWSEKLPGFDHCINSSSNNCNNHLLQPMVAVAVEISIHVLPISLWNMRTQILGGTQSRVPSIFEVSLAICLYVALDIVFHPIPPAHGLQTSLGKWAGNLESHPRWITSRGQ